MQQTKTYQHQARDYRLEWDDTHAKVTYPGGQLSFERFNAHTRPHTQGLDARENLHQQYFGPEGHTLKTVAIPSMRHGRTLLNLGIETPTTAGELEDIPSELYNDIKELLNIPRMNYKPSDINLSLDG